MDFVTAYPSEDMLTVFKEQTNIYIPSIYYFKEDAAMIVEPTQIIGNVVRRTEGEQIVLKACNRCSRYLPIDILDERNHLSFSNHCAQKVCTDNAFSKYEIDNVSLQEIDEIIIAKGKITEKNNKPSNISRAWLPTRVPGL